MEKYEFAKSSVYLPVEVKVYIISVQAYCKNNSKLTLTDFLKH